MTVNAQVPGTFLPVQDAAHPDSAIPDNTANVYFDPTTGLLQARVKSRGTAYNAFTTSTRNELNLVDDLAASVTFSIAAGASTVSEITLTAKDAAGVAMTRAVMLLVWLSDDSGGVGLTATTADGTVGAKASSGTVFGALTAKKALVVQTKTDGTFILSITDSAKTGFYIAARPWHGGAPFVSAQLVSGSYGA